MPKPNWKPAKGTRKAEQRARALAAFQHELREKRKVKIRDGRCRFPLCGCATVIGSHLEVSHSPHKGMGGNPLQNRSDAARMILVCRARHREARFSIDRHTVKWEPLSAFHGANGPLVWYVDNRVLPKELRGRQDWDDEPTRQSWQILAVESRPGWLEPLTVLQRRILAYLNSTL